MKKFLLMAGILVGTIFTSYSQDSHEQLKPLVAKLDQAKTADQFKALADQFGNLASSSGKSDWLSYYYAAYCNAKIGWLYERDGEEIEPFAKLSREQIQKSLSLLDTATQKKELAELYCVLSMANRAMVFINPMTYGREYGIKAGNATRLARAIAPQNPRALFIEGWEKYKTPKMWGGDKAKAKELLTQAQTELQTADMSSVLPHWGKSETAELLQNFH